MHARLRHAAGELHLVGSIHGLVSEGGRVRRLLQQVRPAAVGIAVSAEGIDALSKFEGASDPEMLEEMPTHDLVYSLTLKQYGAVTLPPPDLLAAVRTAGELGASVESVDLTEEAYVEAFTKSVNTWGFLKLGRIQKRLSKKPPKAPNAHAFALAWDERMRKVKGLAKVETLREETIARESRRLLEKHRAPVVVLVDVARYGRVHELLLADGFS